MNNKQLSHLMAKSMNELAHKSSLIVRVVELLAKKIWLRLSKKVLFS